LPNFAGDWFIISVRRLRLGHLGGLDQDAGQLREPRQHRSRSTEEKMTMRTLVLSIAAMLTAPTALAVEALSTAELMSHCDKYYDDQAQEDRVFCVRYIQGFIDGAVVTDERVTRNIVDEYSKGESFSERAARTRIGNRLERYGASVYAEYCLGDPVPLKEVVEHVVEDATDARRVAANPLARDLVYKTLREHYPCPDKD
jgi:hypothetical protein